MPIRSLIPARVPDFWYVFGHSWAQYNFVTRSQAGRMDGAVRSMLDIEFNNWVNHCVNGAVVFSEGQFRGGWTRVANSRTASNFNQYVSPHVAMGGATLFIYGINDLGFAGDDAQYRAAFSNIMSLMISRSRVSVWRDNASTATSAQGGLAYGSNWTNAAATDDFSTGSSVRLCSATGVNSTITITLPSDYKGGAIGLCFVTTGGVTGGTITLGGTAGLTGTISVSNIVPAAILTRTAKFHRITTLTSANASQTITLNMSQVDAGGVIYFDGWWIESLTPPPVIVCNIAKLPDVGYDVYAPLAANSSSVNHAFVDTWNGLIQTVVNEYDSMVQIADMDAAIDTVGGLGAHALTPTMGFDGLHPTEFGASRMAVEVLKAVDRLRPTSVLGSSQNHPQSKRSASLIASHRDGFWYASNGQSTNGTAYTAVAQDVWAVPFFVSGGQWQVTQWSVEKVTNTVAAPTAFMAIYDDREQHGYPRYIHVNPTATALTIGSIAAGVFTSTTTPATNGYLLQPLDAGLYWLVIKIVVAGTTTFRTLAGSSQWMPNLNPSTGGGNVGYSGWKLTGQGTGALPGKFTAGAVATANAPYIGLKMQFLGEVGA